MFTAIQPDINKRVSTDSIFIIEYSGLDGGLLDDSTILFTDASNNVIPFEFTYINDNLSIKPDSNLSLNTIYTITLTGEITPSSLDEDIKFLTDSVDKDYVFKLGSQDNKLDVLYKSSLVDRLLDLEYILTKSEEFNFEFFRTDFDPIEKEYTVSDKQINIENDEVFRSLYKSSLIQDFSDYFDSIRKNMVISNEEYRELENEILRLAFQINTGTGIKKTIEFLFLKYAKSLGYHFLEIQPDPQNFFTYHISTDLPQKYWAEILSKVLHPFSFIDIYSEILQDVNNYQMDEMDKTFQDYFGSIESVVTGDDGLVLINDYTLETRIDLSEFTGDQFANKYYLYINSGDNEDIYRISGNTNNGNNAKNTITLTDAFKKSESAIDFEIKKIPSSLIMDYNIQLNSLGVETERQFQSKIPLLTEIPDTDPQQFSNSFSDNFVETQDYGEILRFYWYSKFISKPKFNFIEAANLGDASESIVSRLIFNTAYNNSLDFIVESSDTNTTFQSGDIRIIRNSNINQPYLMIDSSSGDWNSTELKFGNTTLEIDKSTTTTTANLGPYDIDDISAPVLSGYRKDWQFITITDGVNTTEDTYIKPTHSVSISNAANVENNISTSIIDVDYETGGFWILNDGLDGVEEVSSPASFFHTEEQFLNHNLFTVPLEFSFDTKLLNGYNIFFDSNIIDPRDRHRADQFKFRYAIYNANIDESLISSAFLNTLTIEKNSYSLDSTSLPNSESRITYQYNGTFNFTGEYGFLYEFDVLDPIVFTTGSPIGILRYSSTTSVIVTLFDGMSVDPVKYYSDQRSILDIDGILGADFGSPVTISSFSQIGMPCSITDFNWAVNVTPVTPTAVIQHGVSSNVAYVYKEAGKTYDVDITAITYDAVTISATGDIEYLLDNETAKITRTIGSWVVDGVVDGAKLYFVDKNDPNFGIKYVASVSEFELILAEDTLFADNSTDGTEINSSVQFLNPVNNIITVEDV